MNQRAQFNINQKGQFKWPRQKTASRPKYMEFLRDPIWQFISVIIALIVGIIMPLDLLHRSLSCMSIRKICLSIIRCVTNR